MSHCLQIDFTPEGARRFFGVPMHELVNRTAALDDLLESQAAQLRDRLGLEMTSRPARFALVEAIRRARLERNRLVHPGAG